MHAKMFNIHIQFFFISVISALSKFQKSPNTFIPVHMHLRPRTRSQVTIWNLPTEIVLYIFKGLHIKDILNMRLVSCIVHCII